MQFGPHKDKKTRLAGSSEIFLWNLNHYAQTLKTMMRNSWTGNNDRFRPTVVERRGNTSPRQNWRNAKINTTMCSVVATCCLDLRLHDDVPQSGYVKASPRLHRRSRHTGLVGAATLRRLRQEARQRKAGGACAETRSTRALSVRNPASTVGGAFFCRETHVWY